MMRLIIDAASQTYLRYPLGTVASLAGLLFIAIELFHRRTVTHVRGRKLAPAQREVRFTPLFVGGLETVANLSDALQCRFGATPQQNVNDVLLVIVASAVHIVVSFIIGVVAQSVAAGQLHAVPPAGTVAAMSCIALLLVLHLKLISAFGLPLRYMPAAG